MPKFIRVVMISMAVRQEGAKKRTRHWETRIIWKKYLCGNMEKGLELFGTLFSCILKKKQTNKKTQQNSTFKMSGTPPI